MLCITGIQLSADIILTVYSLTARKERDSVIFKCINISDVLFAGLLKPHIQHVRVWLSKYRNDYRVQRTWWKRRSLSKHFP
jgi:hypothetical protein